MWFFLSLTWISGTTCLAGPHPRVMDCEGEAQTRVTRAVMGKPMDTESPEVSNLARGAMSEFSGQSPTPCLTYEVRLER